MPPPMRSFLLVLFGALAGAGLFHAYYVNLSAASRCGWDHPFDDPAKAACIAQANFKGYGKNERREMDDLIGRVSH
jgi:hypothetical protein